MSSVSKNLKLKLFISLALVLFITTQIQAQFQAMRLIRSSFTVGGGGSTNIPAFCVDEGSGIPGKGDVFDTFSQELYVTRIVNGAKSEPMLLGKQQWIKLSGNDSMTSVSINPIKKEPNVIYEISRKSGSQNADEPIIIGGGDKRAEVAGFAAKLSRIKEAIAKIDKFGDDLVAVFGKQSAIVDNYYNAQIGTVYKIQKSDAANSIAMAEQFINSYKKRYSSEPEIYTSQILLQLFSVQQGDVLSPSQILALERIFGVKLDRTYNADFLVSFKEYSSILKQLRAEFTEESNFYKYFLEYVKYGFDVRDAEYNLDTALKSAKKNLLPYGLKSVQSKEGYADLLSLYLGEKITPVKFALLEKISGEKLGKITGKLDDYVLIVKNSYYADVLINTTSSTEVLNTSELTVAKLKEIKKTHPRVIVFDLDESFALQLRDAGIGNVRTFDSLLKEPVPQPKVNKIFVVSSDKAETLKILFDGQELSSIQRATEAAKKIPNVTIVENLQQLDIERAKLKPNEKGIVVFHNGEAINPVQIAERGLEAISCDLYEFSNYIEFPTTKQFEFETTINALAATQAEFANKPVAMDDMMFKFHANYESQSKLKTLKIRVMVVAGSLGASGVAYLVYSLGTLFSDKDTERIIKNNTASNNRLRYRKQEKLNNFERSKSYGEVMGNNN